MKKVHFFEKNRGNTFARSCIERNFHTINNERDLIKSRHLYILNGSNTFEFLLYLWPTDI